jgi:predicted phosphodiesterase
LWKTFHHIVDICKSEKIDLLLISGDLYESAYSRISDIKRIADDLAAIPDTAVFISPGNHDPVNNASYYNIVRFPSNVHVFRGFESVEVPNSDVVVHGFGWERNRYKESPFDFPALDRDKTNILCLHCDLATASDYLPIPRETLEAAGFDYAALGHIHKAMQVKSNIFYSGSPEPLNFGEEGRHGYVRGEITAKKIALSFVASNKREFLTVQVKIDAEMDSAGIKNAIIKGCGSGMNNNIYRIVFTGIAHPHISIDNVMSDIKDDFYYVDYYDRTVPDYDIKKIYQDNKENIIGKFIYSLTQDATKDPIAYKALLSGLEALLYRQEDNK